jgi:hypothetical protein
MTSQEQLEHVVAQLRSSAQTFRRRYHEPYLALHGIQLDSWADDIEGALSRPESLESLLARAQKMFPGTEIEMKVTMIRPDQPPFGTMTIATPEGWVWTAVLDAETCEFCRARDGLPWSPHFTEVCAAEICRCVGSTGRPPARFEAEPT